MRRRLIVAGLAIAALVGVALALPRVSPHLPHSLATVANLPERLLAGVFPPRVPRKVRLAGLTHAERGAVDTLARRLGGLVVWSSNRTGNHELYLLDLRTRTVRQLTHTPQVEFFSRFSPDGRRILFTRSQRDYVSPRDPTAWDVYVINVDGTGERLLARNGYSPAMGPRRGRDHLPAGRPGDPARPRRRGPGPRVRPPGRPDDGGHRGRHGDPGALPRRRRGSP